MESERGSYAARNRGITEARGSVIAFIDPDCLSDKDWLLNIASAMDETAVMLLLGRRCLPPLFSSLSLLEAYENEKDEYVINGRTETLYYGYTNNMAVRRKLFEDLGLFLKISRGADTIFVRRVADTYSGDVVRYRPDVVVTHLEVRSVADYYRKAFLYGRHRVLNNKITYAQSLDTRQRLEILRKAISHRGLSMFESARLLSLLAGGGIMWHLGTVSRFGLSFIRKSVVGDDLNGEPESYYGTWRFFSFLQRNLVFIKPSRHILRNDINQGSELSKFMMVGERRNEMAQTLIFSWYGKMPLSKKINSFLLGLMPESGKSLKTIPRKMILFFMGLNACAPTITDLTESPIVRRTSGQYQLTARVENPSDRDLRVGAEVRLGTSVSMVTLEDTDGDTIYTGIVRATPCDGGLGVRYFASTSTTDYRSPETGFYPKWFADLGGAFPTDCIQTFGHRFVVNQSTDAGDVRPGDTVCAISESAGRPSTSCTLRAAIEEANVLAGHDLITFQEGLEPIVLSLMGEGEDLNDRGDLDITDSVTIRGNNDDHRTVIDGNDLDRVFDIHASPSSSQAETIVEFVNLTIQSGKETQGGGIRNGAILGVLDSRVIDNVATRGGGIYNTGRLNLRETVVSENSTGDVIISGLPGGGFSGGGLFNNGYLNIHRSTVDANESKQHGGGISNGGHLELVNSTVSNNRAEESGGGLMFGSRGTAIIRNSTITQNEADFDSDGGSGGGIFQTYQFIVSPINRPTKIVNTILAENKRNGASRRDGAECSGRITSWGHNLLGFEDSDCILSIGLAGPDLIGNPELEEVNYLTAPFYVPRESSLAIDAGTSLSPSDTVQLACPSLDQRGISRPQGGGGVISVRLRDENEEIVLKCDGIWFKTSIL